MNCKQFNSIALEEVLQNLGHLPTKHNEKEAWCLNPFATENQPSFKLDKRQNVWFLHSEGIGGNNTDFMQKYLNASVKEVLEWTEKQNFSSFQPQNIIHQKKLKSQNSNYHITAIKELENEHLKNYLSQRGVSPIFYPLVKEVHFTVGNKNLYAVGFQNQSGGWELRNQFYKGAVSKKDISIIHLNQDSEEKLTDKSAAVFEGFMDALSFIEMQKSYKGDLLVMNSVALLNKTKAHLKNYSDIHLFLDNDLSGIKCTSEIIQSFPEAKNHSEIYSGYKDLNDYLMARIKKETEIRQQKEQQNAPGFKRRR